MPVYNERATLRSSLERLLKAELPLPFEVILVDDGSTDGSVETVRDLIDDDRIRLVRHGRNRGKGAALRTGIEIAGGDLLTVMDADLEYDPSDYRPLLAPLMRGESSVVYGTRSFGALSPWSAAGNRFIGLWASVLYRSPLRDVETCFKLAETRLWRELDLVADGFGIEAEVTAKLLKAGHRIEQVPIRYEARTRAEGKKIGWRDGVEALWILLRIRLLRH
jgi:glycosyltransferase involved in cell wall biosynthesis